MRSEGAVNFWQALNWKGTHLKYAKAFALIAAISSPSLVWTANGVSSIEISQNKVNAGIELPGDLKADLELSFEQVLGLNAQSLGLSAKLIDPTSLNLISRLPTSASIPAAFPVMITIDPPSTGPLAFSGIVTIDFHTHNLAYTPNSPFRLMAAEAGKNFQDLTGSNALGSYRTGGSKGGFSEFLIVADIRPANTVITEKFQRLQSKLDDNATAIGNTVLTTLQSTLAAARTAFLANDPLAAAEKIKQFAEIVGQNSGSAIPDVWRSARDVVNVAGDLRSGAATLKFSLLLKASGGS
jgi:hypothetical protein